MNASNVIAWLLCLVLAFFAAALAIRNLGETVRIQKQLAEIEEESASAVAQSDLLEDIRSLLREIEKDLRYETAPRPSADSTPPEKGPEERQDHKSGVGTEGGTRPCAATQ